MTSDDQENNVCEPWLSDRKRTPKDGVLKSRQRSHCEPPLSLRATYSRFLCTCAAGKTGNQMPLSAFGEFQWSGRWKNSNNTILKLLTSISLSRIYSTWIPVRTGQMKCVYTRLFGAQTVWRLSLSILGYGRRRVVVLASGRLAVTLVHLVKHAEWWHSDGHQRQASEVCALVVCSSLNAAGHSVHSALPLNWSKYPL